MGTALTPVTTLHDYLAKAGAVDPPAFARDVAVTFGTVFPHQVVDLNKALKHNRWAFYNEPGTGKTLPAQAWAAYLAGYGNRVVGVMPPTLVTQFHRSFHSSLLGIERHLRIVELNQGPKARQTLYQQWEAEGWPDVVLLSYQLFVKESRALIDAGYRVLLADEAHALKNPGSLNHKTVDRFLGCVIEDTALLLMTGTPSTNTLMDYYGMIRLTSPGCYPTQRSFERQHCQFVLQQVPDRRIPGGSRQIKKLVGFKNKDRLHENLFHRATRVLKDDVFDLDKPVIQRVPVELSATHQALYKKLVKERFLQVQDRLIDATTAQSLRQKCLRIATCPHLFADKAPPNRVLETVATLLDSIGAAAGEKCLIYCHFQDTVETLAEHFKQYHPVLLYGGTKGPKQAQVDRFVNDPDCQLLIANTQSGGEGVDGLQKVCRYAIFVEPTSTPGRFKQAVDRLRRSGQKHVVTVYILDILKTASRKLTDDMLRKESEALEVTRDPSSILDELLGRTAA